MSSTVRRSVKIGPQMRRAADYVERHPGCCICDAARAIHPHPGNPQKNWAIGYNPVHRAIDAGLIEAVQCPSGRYVLTIPGYYGDGPSDMVIR